MKSSVCALFVLLIAAAPAYAVDIGIAEDDRPLQIHAFASQGYIKDFGNNWLAPDTKSRGSFEFSETGINFTKDLTDKLRTGMQLFARKLGQIGDYNVRLDWFYIDYHWQDWLGLRAGRVKIPFGLYNEINDVDSARVSVMLPQSVYPTQNRDFLLAQTGAELYGLIPLSVLGALEYRLYGGAIFIPLNEIVTSPGSPVVVANLHVPYLLGGRIMWETPLEGLRIGASVQDLRLDTNFVVAGAPDLLKIPALLSVFSVEYVRGNLLLASEYSRWQTKAISQLPDVIPNIGTAVSERGYVMAAYRITDWLQPGAYYSVSFPDTRKRIGRAQVQNDIAATLRFDINRYWLVKLEGHYMIGTALLDSTLNNNTPLSQLNKDWAALFVKTTAYF